MSTDPPETTAASSVKMREMLYGSLITQLLVISAELGVPDLVAGEPQHVNALAARTATDPGALYRILRTLASQGVFTEVSPGTFGLTSLAATLRSDAEGSLRDAARAVGLRERQHALTELEYSVRTGQPSFDHVYGMDWWSYLATQPEQAAIFNNYLRYGASRVHAAAIDAYDLSGTRRLVDVGGNRGNLVARILRRYPEMRAVVFDSPQVLAGAEAVLAEAGVFDRAELVGGDFFEAVPAGGDTYVLSWVLHDWNDGEAQKLLSNVRRAMDPAGSLLVIDAVIPTGDTAHPGKFSDIAMLALQTGGERTEEEFAALFEASGLRHVETHARLSPTSVIVAEPA